ncbi:exopolysaccharide biosynthesis protein [Azoarcus sp. CIB]|uniref:DNA-binding protein n=1 Tax=Aromatoleum sp. (strain CIB) TaxID=198107 RepID=UPI0006A2A327|nr:DNA-binding protein [Azoarcus sp. CIB]AKU11558.1 exopolysaccharide biosynthesis protein [Azoarcus sp. CIB]
MNIDAQIREDIDALRETTSNTQDLYREVCALLFFRYGITPTANKLYQFVKKGSMSAPAEALARFWEELREKSRVRIEHPELPESLKVAAAEMVGRLWTEAQAQAKECFDVFRREADGRVDEANTARLQTEQDRQTAINELEQLHEALDAASERNLALERSLATERAEKQSLRGQFAAAREQQQGLEGELSEARKDFSAELQKLRDAVQWAEERYEASEKRALLEIDRERTAAAKSQKELAQQRQANVDQAERHRSEASVLQRELGNVRQELGTAEGGLVRMRELADQHTAQLDVLREQLAQRAIETALLRRDLELRGEKLRALELRARTKKKVLAPHTDRVTPKRATRKSLSEEPVESQNRE